MNASVEYMEACGHADALGQIGSHKRLCTGWKRGDATRIATKERSLAARQSIRIREARKVDAAMGQQVTTVRNTDHVRIFWAQATGGKRRKA